MSRQFFFIMFVQFMLAGEVTRRWVGRNRGNIVYLPPWRKAANNCLDGILVSFVLYFILNKEVDQEVLWRLAVCVSASIMGLFVLEKGIRYSYSRYKSVKRQVIMDMSGLDLVNPVKRSAREAEHLKCVIIIYYKTMLLFWTILYFVSMALKSSTGSELGIDETSLISLDRYFLVLSVLTVWCVINNLWVLLMKQTEEESHSPELERIHQKLQVTRNQI